MHRIEYIQLEEVLRWPRNPKTHDEAGMDASLERFGFVQPLIIDETTKQLVAGHGRLEALQRRKAAGKSPPSRIVKKGDGWMVPVVRGITFGDAANAELYLIADNRLTEAGGWNDAALAEMLARLGADKLEGTGFEWEDVEALYRRTSASLQVDVAESSSTVGGGLEEGSMPPSFQSAEIKQVVIRFSKERYPAVVEQLEKAAEAMGLSSNTDVVQKLVKDYVLKELA